MNRHDSHAWIALFLTDPIPVAYKDPFPHHSDYGEFVRAIVEDEERPPIPVDTPSHLRLLMESCWDPYPENRPDFEEINAALDEIIIEVAIHEASACRFWMRYFLKEVRYRSPRERASW